MGEDTKPRADGSAGRDERGVGDGDQLGAAPAHTSATEWQLDAGDLPILNLGVPAPVSEDEARLLAFVAQTTGQILPPKRPANLPLVVGAEPGQVAPRTTIRDALLVNAPPPIRERTALAPPSPAPPRRASPTAAAASASSTGLDRGGASIAAPTSVPRTRATPRRSSAPSRAPLSPLLFVVAAALAAGFMLFLMLVTPGVEGAGSGARAGAASMSKPARDRIPAPAASRR